MRAAGVTRVVKYKRQDQDTWRRELDQQCKPARCLARSSRNLLQTGALINYSDIAKDIDAISKGEISYKIN